MLLIPLQWKTICSRDSTTGVCSAASAGGHCRGTPRECKDCNSIADCAGSSVKGQFPHFPEKLEPTQTHTGSVFAARDKRVCSTSCNNWPNGNCRVRLSIFLCIKFFPKMTILEGTRKIGFSECIPPFSDKRHPLTGKLNWKNKNYPE